MSAIGNMTVQATAKQPDLTPKMYEGCTQAEVGMLHGSDGKPVDAHKMAAYLTRTFQQDVGAAIQPGHGRPRG